MGGITDKTRDMCDFGHFAGHIQHFSHVVVAICLNYSELQTSEILLSTLKNINSLTARDSLLDNCQEK